MQFVPVCHFPTTVLFVDDNKKFLDTLFVNLNIDHFICQPFTTPYGALEYINKECPSHPFLTNLVRQADETEWEHRTLDVNINEIYREVYNPKRFNQVSTVVVDYDMPGMNGLELCEKIILPHVRKIMLTGAADEQLAIQAFNEGTIHKFINKNSPDLDVQLNKAIAESIEAYFHEISQVFIHTLNVSWGGTALTEPVFTQLMHQLVAKYHIVESYLFQGTGSFLMLDKAGNDYGLFIKEEKELQALLESEEIESTDATLHQSVINFETLLCYHHEDEYCLPNGHEWPPYMQPARILNGSKKYYYAFAPRTLHLHRNQVISFDHYKKNSVAAYKG